MIRKLILAATCLACLPGLSAQTAPEPPAAQQIEGIVAVVNDDPISFTDVRLRARMLLLSLGGAQPTQEQIQQLTSEALEQLIDEKLQLQEASEFEVEVSEDDIANSIENLAQQSGMDRQTLFDSLLQAGINPSSLEDQSRADIAWRRIMGGLYGSRIRISDSQITDHLSRLKTAAEEEQYQLSEIFLFAPRAEDREAAMTAAESIKAQLEAGAPFAVAAERFSSAPTAATGGDMGWVTLDALDEARSAVVQALSGPGLTPPIPVEDGVYLISVRGKREPSERTSVVDITRMTVEDGDADALLAAASEANTCENIATSLEGNDNIKAIELTGIKIDELGPEGRSMVMNTEVGAHTDIFSQSGKLALLFVCSREDDVENLPTKQQIEDRLYTEQLGMISERSLRNLRREATIIRR